MMSMIKVLMVMEQRGWIIPRIMDHTSSNVENGSNERFDVMLVAAQDAEGQCRHHDNQAANDDW